jgi:hypothetical protein
MYIAATMRDRASIAIHLMLAALILAPMHYYACNGDKRDERFAWRMFSPTRVEQCSAQFFVGEAPRAIRASTEFHNAWVGVAQRGRKQVLKAMAATLCERNPDKGVRIRVLCEQYPGAAASNKGLLYDPNLSESNKEIEVVSRGLFNYCVTESL